VPPTSGGCIHSASSSAVLAPCYGWERTRPNSRALARVERGVPVDAGPGRLLYQKR